MSSPSLIPIFIQPSIDVILPNLLLPLNFRHDPLRVYAPPKNVHGPLHDGGDHAAVYVHGLANYVVSVRVCDEFHAGVGGEGGTAGAEEARQ